MIVVIPEDPKDLETLTGAGFPGSYNFLLSNQVAAIQYARYVHRWTGVKMRIIQQ